jgi:hypothetical protein
MPKKSPLPLRAGAAQVDVTPTAGTHLGGNVGVLRRAETFLAHCTNDCAGYIAPRASYARGGHEIRKTPAKWTRLEEGSLETIVENTVNVLKEVFP